MFERVRQALRKFAHDPLSACIELAVYLFLLALGVYILIIFARVAWGMVRGALGA